MPASHSELPGCQYNHTIMGVSPNISSLLFCIKEAHNASMFALYLRVDFMWRQENVGQTNSLLKKITHLFGRQVIIMKLFSMLFGAATNIFPTIFAMSATSGSR